MTRTRKILLATVGVIAGLPLVMLVVLVIAGNLPPGQRLIESETASLTGGMSTGSSICPTC